MYSRLRGVGEAVKAINENLLTCGYVQAYAYARSARGCARSCVREGDGKVGRKEKESGGGSEEGGVNEERKDCRWKIKVEQRMKKGKTRIGKVFSQCKKRSVAIIKGEIS